jgi:hypothetical protein
MPRLYRPGALPNPTAVAYDWLRRAHSHFNRELFVGEALPPVLFTFARKPGMFGYYSPKRFSERGDETVAVDEVALNPVPFRTMATAEILQTVLHEMCHEWQHHFGHPPKRHYHNMEWAAKMMSVGLMPSHTGQAGGNFTGSHMSDYIIENGPFPRVAAAFVEAEGEVPYVDLTPAKRGRPRVKARPSSPVRNANRRYGANPAPT